MNRISDCGVVVTGLGVVSAFGLDCDSLWSGLCKCEHRIGAIRSFSTQGCRVTVGAEAPFLPIDSEAGSSRTAALALFAARSALEQANWPQAKLQRVGLVLGSTGGGIDALEQYLMRRKAGGGQLTAVRLLGYPKRAATDVVASRLKVGGPRSTINTACSSGAVAVIHGVQFLMAGLCDAVLVGGSDELLRYTLTGFCSLRAVDPEPCRPFDKGRKGMSLGEGAGFLFLERLSHAVGRGVPVFATVAGFGHTCDAGHLTAPDATGHGAAMAMQEALTWANVSPCDVAFVNAHGTGTPLNDAAEVAAIRSVFEKTQCPVHSAKSSIGHCMGAAGSIESIITILSLRHQLVPPTCGLVEPEAEGINFIQREPLSIKGRYGLTNSFGFGGNNASLLFGLLG